MKYNYLLIGEIIRNERLKNNYSIRGLARLVGMSDTELSRWENGERINYNLILLIRLCEILKINFINLLKVSNYLPVNYTEEVSNKEKFADGLATLGKKELSQLIEEDGKAEIQCQFCDKRYEFNKEELEEILKRSK